MKNPIPISLILLATILLVSSPGQHDGRVQFTINHGGYPLRVVLSCDELHCTPGDGGVSHSIAIPMQKNFGETKVQASTLAAVNEDRLDLVLYPAGVEKRAETRLVLQRKITLKLRPGADISKIAATAGAVDFLLPDYAPGYAVLTFSEPGESLSKVGDVARIDGVAKAEVMLARQRQSHFVPNDPLYSSRQWHLNNSGQNGGTAGVDLNIETVWDSYKGNGVVVGIVDEGLDLDHPDLIANIDTSLDRNWNDGDANDSSSRSTAEDHGTPCAGIAAGRGNNGIGGSGVAPEATLVGLRLNWGSRGDQEEAESAAWRNDVISVKSNSWGNALPLGILEPHGPLYQAALEDSVENGRGGLGTINLRSAGNQGLGADSNWEQFNNRAHTISVCAVDRDGIRLDFSRPGSSNLISAFGTEITTTNVNGGTTHIFNGTSAACPMVAGICALMLEANPGLGWRDVQEILIRSARKIDAADPLWVTNGAGFHFNYLYGAGLVDAAAAVSLAESWTNLGPRQQTQVARADIDLGVPDAGGLIGSPDRLRIPFRFDDAAPTRVEHAIVSLDIGNRQWGQMEMHLISPDGTDSLLSQTNPGGQGWLDGWELMSTHHWGELSQGVWYLEFVDTVPGDVGIIESATLTLHGSAVAPIVQAPVHTSPALVTAPADSYFELILTAGNGATSFSASGLPTGLEIDEQTGFVSGYPTVEGSYSVAITATNPAGTADSNLTIQVDPREPTLPTITSGAATGRVGMSFSYQIETDYPVSSYSTSELPAGLNLNATTGQIFGTPTMEVTMLVHCAVSNPDGSDQTGITFTIHPIEGGPFGIALDTSEHFFFTGGDAPWFVQSSEFTEGGSALRAGSITSEPWPADPDRSILYTYVDGPGVVRFDWRSSADQTGDGLQFYVADPDIEDLEATTEFQRIRTHTGESDWSRELYVVPAGRHKLLWHYVEDDFVEGASGMQTGWLDHFEFTPGLPPTDLPINDSLDYQGLEFEFEGQPWIGQSLHTFDGADAVRSAKILDRQTSFSDRAETTMSTTVTGPGQLSFHWKIDADPFAGYVGAVYLAQSLAAEIIGLEDWTQVTVEVPAGSHEVTWAYEKFGVGFVKGEDAIWIDQVRWNPDGSNGYERWVMQSFSPDQLSNQQRLTPLDDFDGDQMSNLFEYKFGLDPRRRDPRAFPVVGFDQDGLSLMLPRPASAADEATWSVEASTDLQIWEEISGSISGAPGGQIRVRFPESIDADRMAARIKVTLEP